MIDKLNGEDPMQYAQKHCNKGEFDCSWYHGSWYLLKSLGIVSTSAVHTKSINQLLTLATSGLAPGTNFNILITGSTDESLVRLVHDFCSDTDLKERIYAIDICASPLAFMSDYADKNDIELTTFQSDILNFESEQKFDIILTHAFMGYFDDEQRPQLVRKWQQLLSANGKIVTIQRVRPKTSPKLVKFTDAQSANFTEAAITAASARPIEERPDLDLVERSARLFARNFISHAITSKAALESLFTDNGMQFHSLEYHMLDKKGELSGPSVPSNAEFAHIIAENVHT